MVVDLPIINRKRRMPAHAGIASVWVLSFLLTACGSVPDASSLNIQQMIVNIAATMPSLLAMVTGIAYVMGFLLVMKAIYKLKEYGEARTMMGNQTSIWPPLITLIVGSMLIYFVSAYKIGLSTLFNSSQPEIFSYSGDDDATDTLVQAVVTIMQVVGSIAFIRGLLLLNGAGSPGAQPGTMGKSLTFIIGGLLAINIYGTWEVLINTLVGT